MFLTWKIRILQCAFAIVLSIFLARVSDAQVGVETNHWTWTSRSSHHDAVVKIKTPGGSGTGVLVHVFDDKPLADGHEGLCLTAHHVVADNEDDRNVKVVWNNGKRAKRCKVVASSKALDIAVLWVWVPDGVDAVSLANVEATIGDSLEFSGLGGGSELDQLRHFSSRAESPTNSNLIFASVPLLPGDSGGPVFNLQGEVVGIISGGWFWFDGGVTSQNGSSISVTWPARACNLVPLQDLLKIALNNNATIADNR